MIKAILSVSLLVVICEAQLRAVPVPALLGAGRILAEDLAPKPYAFAFNTADEYGTNWQRSETADGSGAVRGSYGYKDAAGIYRTVEYVADDLNGFRANVVSNEPGLVNSAPAGVTYSIQ